MRHRVITALAAGLLTVAFAGCGGDDPTSSPRPGRRRPPLLRRLPRDRGGHGVRRRDAHDDGADCPPRAPAPTLPTGVARPGRGQRVRRQRRLDVRGDRRRRRVDVRPRRRHRLATAPPWPSSPAASSPTQHSIRVEEWVNAFDYDDPAPTDGPRRGRRRDGRRTARRRRHGAGAHRCRHGRPSTDADRPPANITFVIDTSGSMDIRDRLGLVQSSLALLVQHLRDDDTIAIVTYGDDATPVLRTDDGRRRRAHHRRHRRARPGRQHEHGGRAAARLPAGPRGLRPRRAQRRRAGLRRRRQRRHHRPDRADRRRSPRPARRASTSSPSATAWATTTTT